jgi:hypothetical protein
MRRQQSIRFSSGVERLLEVEGLKRLSQGHQDASIGTDCIRCVLKRIRAISREPLTERDIRRWMHRDETHRVGIGPGSLAGLLPRVRVSPIWVALGGPREATAQMREAIDHMVFASG